MHHLQDWPSLADELALAQQLYGSQGTALIADWFDDEMNRVTDPAFARSFADHIDLPGVTAGDYLQRVIRTQAGSLLGGIRFYGRDIGRPFIEIVAHSFDELDRLRDCVASEWSIFAPKAMRLRCLPGALSGAGITVDTGTYVGRRPQMRPPSPQIRLRPFDTVAVAQTMVHTRYRALAADNPALARNISAAHDDELQGWHDAGHLHAVCTPGAIVGLFAVAPGRIGWITGHEICEEIITVEHQGHGYAALGQAAWAAMAPDDDSFLIGTINRLNISSQKTAQAAGRRRVLEAVFVDLCRG